MNDPPVSNIILYSVDALERDLAQLDDVDGLHGAGLVAFAAADALGVVDLGAEVFDLHGVVFARLHALHAADAARFALFSG